MSKTKSKLPVFTIRQAKRAKTGVMVGANTEVLVDGKRVRGVTKAAFEVKAAGLATLTLTYVGLMKINGRVRVKKMPETRHLSKEERVELIEKLKKEVKG